MMVNNKRPLFLLEEELSYKIRGILIEISKEHGYLYKEKIYQNIIKQKFNANNIKFVEYPRITLHHIINGVTIGNYYPDFLVEDKIIIEIKAQNQIFDSHINQLIRYLNASRYEIGFLVNFGTPRVQIIRRIYSNKGKEFLRR